MSTNQLQALADEQLQALVDHLTNHQLQTLAQELNPEKLQIIVPILNDAQLEALARDLNPEEVKEILPHLESFESDKEKNAQVKYVHTILDKLIADLNDTFVPKLNDVLKGHQDYMDELYDNSNRVEELVMHNKKDLKFLKENFNSLKEEVEN